LAFAYFRYLGELIESVNYIYNKLKTASNPIRLQMYEMDWGILET